MSCVFSALCLCAWLSSEEAKANAPCVIFIDELDSVGGKRIESPMHPYSRQTINQLLAEMDGYGLHHNGFCRSSVRESILVVAQYLS